MMIFKNLRSIREDRDIKQRELAELLHISQNTYSQYETGTIALTAEVLLTLADYYHCSVDYLLDRTNDPSFPYKRK
jgi:transcriptional regulator with XRE-family HTH domain